MRTSGELLETERAAQKPPRRYWLGGIQARDATWLLAMSTMLFVLLFPFSSYVAALPLIKEEWGLNNTQAGLIFSAYLAGFAASALFVLPLTDRYGSKSILIGFASISVVSHILFPLFADGLVTAVVLRILAGLGLVGVYNPGMRLVAERFAKNGRGMAVGTYVTFFYASNSVSLALTGILMAHLDWPRRLHGHGADSGIERSDGLSAAPLTTVPGRRTLVRRPGPVRPQE